jgi:hypothetical protein
VIQKVISITSYNFRLKEEYNNSYFTVILFIESTTRFPLCCILKSKLQAPNRHNFAINPFSAILEVLDSFPPAKKIPEDEMDALWFSLARHPDYL